MLKLLTDEQVEVLYLSWINDFLTIECFAEYWRLDEGLAIDIINKGRSNNRRDEHTGRK